jgi:hypothetical protein
VVVHLIADQRAAMTCPKYDRLQYPACCMRNKSRCRQAQSAKAYGNGTLRKLCKEAIAERYIAKELEDVEKKSRRRQSNGNYDDTLWLRTELTHSLKVLRLSAIRFLNATPPLYVARITRGTVHSHAALCQSIPNLAMHIYLSLEKEKLLRRMD